MTWASRIRLVVGVIVVAVIAALATYQLNETRGVAQSDSAQILARTYSVGTPYSGLVVDQKVDVGDTVKTGDPLFVIDSATLQYDIRNGFARQATEATQIDPDGKLVILATGDGTVTKVGSERGTFVQSAAELATVQRAGTLYVQAEYTLSAKEYARVPDGAAVTIVLPDQREIDATVERNAVETVGGQAQAVFTITGDDLVEGRDGLVSAGTPVTAELHLTNDGVVTRTADSVKTYLKGLFG
ncbi:HlyD family efflux transporter periplasmic adaptor subunit [Cellulomonas septica]|uniref:HlyD family efflux transporter periplasmic adaptor subunit n=1 Tax=Cellulomonas septica TaxID=285080 RepID=A0ABX1K1G4_9CELL|nr:HlyD family efflux transporter periplasmic adaptor subunit [Cellulomonas septica]NKY39994.1 HlyD family efflux transporter periplasmic adaptor subunit [Cellulomonas septica]